MKALLVIDMLNDFILPEGKLYVGEEGLALIPAISAVIGRFRSENRPVIYVCDQHKQDDAEFQMFPLHCLKDSTGAEVVAELAPQAGDVVIRKRRYSAFFGTELDLTLREAGISELVLAGVCTNICVLYTAADARNLGYAVTLPKDCVASFDPSAHLFALGQMKDVLGVKVEEVS